MVFGSIGATHRFQQKENPSRCGAYSLLARGEMWKAANGHHPITHHMAHPVRHAARRAGRYRHPVRPRIRRARCVPQPPAVPVARGKPHHVRRPRPSLSGPASAQLVTNSVSASSFPTFPRAMHGYIITPLKRWVWEKVTGRQRRLRRSLGGKSFAGTLLILIQRVQGSHARIARPSRCRQYKLSAGFEF